MFVKISDQYYNMNNVRYFTYENDHLEIFFLSGLSTKIEQTTQDYNHFVEFIEKNRLAFVEKNIGVNIKTLNNFNITKNKNNSFFFIDGTIQQFDISVVNLEKYILEE
jgi:hypothetical protein